jgi:regulator of sirC expression with transglutaminase-like and TPR domain
MARAQASRRRRAAAPARKSARSAEDLMFFPKLRRRAKWVFAFLALAFGIGFVAFGVGTGVSGTSLGDVLRDIIGQQSAGGDVEDAQKKALENPQDAEAQLEWANALQQAGRTREAITALQGYTALRPEDADALRQLANLWGSVATRASDEAQVARAQAAEAAGAQTFAQPDSPFLQEAEQNKIAQTLSAEANARADAADAEAQQAAAQQQAVYVTLTELEPDDPTLFLSLALAAQDARDYQAAIDAFREFLALAPNDPNAEQVKAQIKVLEQFLKGNPLLQGESG